MSARLAAMRRAGGSFGRGFGGISAIGAKELRGRMRGRRAFVVLTVYLGVLAGFAWMLESLQANAYENAGFGVSTYASPQIGAGIFAGLLILETLLVLFLAPAFTAGAISQEREKQTLDLLVTTPISSLSIVLGKLFSALAWVFLLVVASIPLTALVFVFGGVGPEDVLRGYLVLLIEALGLGCVGLFFSALLKRTLAATIATYSVVLAATVGATFVYVFISATNPSATVVRADGSTSQRSSAPEAILWFNPFVADMDVLCPTGNGYGGTCSIISAITGQDPNSGFVQNVVAPAMPNAAPFAVPPGAKVLPDGSVIAPDGSILANGGGVLRGADVAPQAVADPGTGLSRDIYWPRSAIAWLVVSVVLVLLSVNLVSPTRRWRPRLRRPRLGRSSVGSGGGTGVAAIVAATGPGEPVADDPPIVEETGS